MSRNRIANYVRRAECPDDLGDTNDTRLRTQAPPKIAEVIDDTRRYPGSVLRAMKQLRSSHAWRGTRGEQEAKFKRVHQSLCKALGCTVELEFAHNFHHEWTASDQSHYDPRRNVIVLKGRTSVVTYLHLLSLARGKSTYEAVSWSVNLFKRVFPKSFARCRHDGFILRR